MKKLLLIFLIGLCCFTLNFFLSNNSYAQDSVDLKSPLTATSIEGIIKGIISFLFKIGIVLAPLMIIVGGFLFVTAGLFNSFISSGYNRIDRKFTGGNISLSPCHLIVQRGIIY